MVAHRWDFQVVVLLHDGLRELQYECGHHGHILALYVQSRKDIIIVGDLMKSISLLIYKVCLFFNSCEEILVVI